MRAAGVDPGTKSFDIVVLEDGRVCAETSIPSSEVARSPGVIAEFLMRLGPPELIVGPSGYGIPLKHISEVTEDDVFLMTLVRPDDAGIPVLVGLSKVVRELRKSGLNVYFIPGVVHLPTVPRHRKINAIDMGTADKLCCAALAIHDYAGRHSLPYSEVFILVVEVGYGYNAVMAVERGVVVDGIGGTRAGPGFLTAGGLDGEVAYLLSPMGKEMLFRGGVKDVVGAEISPEELPSLAGRDEAARAAWSAFMEGLEKTAWSLVPVMSRVDAVIVSGRLSRVDPIYRELARRLGRIARVERVQGLGASSKEAAQGAALIADGLAGGSAKRLVDHMRIREASGTVLDHIYIPGFKERLAKIQGDRPRRS